MGDKWYMAGTEGTGQYVVIAVSPLGRVGFRRLNGETRVRLEPENKKVATEAGMYEIISTGWKRPDWSDKRRYRFSMVPHTAVEAVKALDLALKAIGLEGVQFNPFDGKDWVEKLAESYGMNAVDLRKVLAPVQVSQYALDELKAATGRLIGYAKAIKGVKVSDLPVVVAEMNEQAARVVTLLKNLG